VSAGRKHCEPTPVAWTRGLVSPSVTSSARSRQRGPGTRMRIRSLVQPMAIVRRWPPLRCARTRCASGRGVDGGGVGMVVWWVPGGPGRWLFPRNGVLGGSSAGTLTAVVRPGMMVWSVPGGPGHWLKLLSP